MKCPKCVTRDLVATLVREVEVDRCKQCRGIWCDHRELGELLTQSKWQLGKLIGSKDRQDLNRKKSQCPRDGTDLLRVCSADNPAVVLDSCPKCNGIWLDGGELDELLAGKP